MSQDTKVVEGTNLAGTASANQFGSAGAGSPGGDAGAKIDLDKYIPRKDYEELQGKLGENSEELGNLRTFFKDISPLLDKLQDAPEIAEAILEGKLTVELTNAIMEGKVSLEDATQVAEAHGEVKKDLGIKKYDKTSPEVLEKLVSDKLRGLDEKIEKAASDFKAGLSEVEEKREFQDKVENFMGSVKDFADYSEEIAGWLEKHPNVYDIETAYYAVKGKVLADKASKDADVTAAEEAKNVAANAGSGFSQGKRIAADSDIVDSLMSGKTNVNTL